MHLPVDASFKQSSVQYTQVHTLNVESFEKKEDEGVLQLEIQGKDDESKKVDLTVSLKSLFSKRLTEMKKIGWVFKKWNRFVIRSRLQRSLHSQKIDSSSETVRKVFGAWYRHMDSHFTHLEDLAYGSLINCNDFLDHKTKTFARQYFRDFIQGNPQRAKETYEKAKSDREVCSRFTFLPSFDEELDKRVDAAFERAIEGKKERLKLDTEYDAYLKDFNPLQTVEEMRKKLSEFYKKAEDLKYPSFRLEAEEFMYARLIALKKQYCKEKDEHLSKKRDLEAKCKGLETKCGLLEQRKKDLAPGILDLESRLKEDMQGSVGWNVSIDASQDTHCPLLEKHFSQLWEGAKKVDPIAFFKNCIGLFDAIKNEKEGSRDRLKSLCENFALVKEDVGDSKLPINMADLKYIYDQVLLLLSRQKELLSKSIHDLNQEARGIKMVESQQAEKEPTGTLEGWLGFSLFQSPQEEQMGKLSSLREENERKMQEQMRLLGAFMRLEDQLKKSNLGFYQVELAISKNKLHDLEHDLEMHREKLKKNQELLAIEKKELNECFRKLGGGLSQEGLYFLAQGFGYSTSSEFYDENNINNFLDFMKQYSPNQLEGRSK